MSRVIAVLGMHRSGTSALMGVLESAGVYIGDANEHSTDNTRGNKELLAIKNLHDDLLGRNGASWKEPKETLHWDVIHHTLREEIVRGFEDYPIWGFKDPRTLLCIAMWLKKLPRIEIVATFRQPMLVAQSLYKRNGIGYEEGLLLWLAYNNRLLWALENHQTTHVIEFSSLGGDYQHQLLSLISSLGLSVDGAMFFDPAMRSVESELNVKSPLFNRCMNVFEKLQSYKTTEIVPIDSESRVDVV